MATMFGVHLKRQQENTFILTRSNCKPEEEHTLCCCEPREAVGVFPEGDFQSLDLQGDRETAAVSFKTPHLDF